MIYNKGCAYKMFPRNLSYLYYTQQVWCLTKTPNRCLGWKDLFPRGIHCSNNIVCITCAAYNFVSGVGWNVNYYDKWSRHFSAGGEVREATCGSLLSRGLHVEIHWLDVWVGYLHVNIIQCVFYDIKSNMKQYIYMVATCWFLVGENPFFMNNNLKYFWGTFF